ncbi:MAG: DNA polymerase [Acetivibrionales bacterium]
MGKNQIHLHRRYLEHINSVTGRIHPDMFPLGTETGRFAARNPNLQNCPRKDNDPVGVRNFFIAPKGEGAALSGLFPDRASGRRVLLPGRADAGNI